MFALPVLEKELISAARRKRTFISRTAYMVILFSVVSLTWLDWRLSRPDLVLTALPRLGRELFVTFAICQFVLVVILTPALAAGAIASEKDKRTLGVLFTTDLGSFEIILGKLLACLLNVEFLVLSGIPIMCVSLMFGGVSLGEIIAVFVTTSVTVLFAGSVALLFSVILRKGYVAAIISYLVLLVSGVGAPVAIEELFTGGGWGDFLADVEAYINPSLIILGTLDNDRYHIFANKSSWIAGLIVCTLVCTFLSFLLVLLSSLLLRRAAEWSGTARLKRIFAAMDNFFERHNWRNIKILKEESREVWGNPVAWREVNTRAFGKGRYFLRLAYASVILMMLFCLVFAGTMVHADAQVIVVCTQFSLILLLATVLSTSSISSERDVQSFDVLLTTTINPREIVLGKFVGVARYVGLLICFLTIHCAIFSAMDIISPSSAPLVAVEAVICAAFFVSLGMFFSLVCKSSARAFFWTLILLLLICGGPLLLDELLLTDTERYSSRPSLGLTAFAKCSLHFGSPFSWILESVTPSIAKYRHTYSWYWVGSRGQAWHALKITIMFFWLVAYAIGSVVFAVLTIALFDKFTRRCE